MSRRLPVGQPIGSDFSEVGHDFVVQRRPSSGPCTLSGWNEEDEDDGEVLGEAEIDGTNIQPDETNMRQLRRELNLDEECRVVCRYLSIIGEFPESNLSGES